MIAYSDEDWTAVVEHLEKAILEFYVAEERCRADCEDTMETSSASHFTGVIAGRGVCVCVCVCVYIYVCECVCACVCVCV